MKNMMQVADGLMGMKQLIRFFCVGSLLLCWVMGIKQVQSDAHVSTTHSRQRFCMKDVMLKDSATCLSSGCTSTRIFPRGGSDADVDEETEQDSDGYENEYEYEEDANEEDVSTTQKNSETGSKALSKANADSSSGIISALFETVTTFMNKFWSFLFPIASESTKEDISVSKKHLDESTTNTVLTGKFQTALQISRRKARLLVVFIPGGNRKSKTFDEQCVASLSNDEVIDFAESYKGGSYLVWDGRQSDGSERMKVIKSLRVKNNPKCPTLAVIHPLEKVDPLRGSVVVVPIVLAQHHCQPPPTSSAMAAWLKSIRRRHGKLIATMKVASKEQQLYEERRKGYAESLQSDAKREQQELLERQKKEEEERIAQEKAKERESLRRELMNNLPEEPEAGSAEAITIGLRFPDGKSVRRRFSFNEEAKFIFDWIYGEFDIEFERLSLATMTGSKTFVYDDIRNGESTIAEVVGKSKMAALRVLVTKSETLTADELEKDENISEEDKKDSALDA